MRHFQQYGAFTTFFQVLAIKIFGGKLLVIKYQTVFFMLPAIEFVLRLEEHGRKVD